MDQTATTFWIDWLADGNPPILCETCNKPLTEKQIKKALKQNRIPKYCSTICWGTRPRDHNYNDQFLNIDNENEFSSYFMGLWVADGHISRYDKSVSITSVDKQLIDLIVSYTNFENKIRERDPNRQPKDKRRKRRKIRKSQKIQYTISFFGDITKQVQAMGYPLGAKSGKEFIPDRFKEEQWFHHFVRGFFDGDGSIGFGRKGSLTAHIVNMSKEVLEDIHEWLYSRKIIRGGVVFKVKKKKLWKLQFGHFDTVQFCEFIYKGAEYYLERKHDRYLIGKDYIQGCVPQTNTECIFIDCEEPAKVKGLCKKHYDKAYGKIHRAANKEHIREKNREWIAANRDKINVRRRKSYAENPEPHRESSRKYRKTHPEEVREYKRVDNILHPEKRRKQRKALRAKNGDNIRAQERGSYQRNKENKLAGSKDWKERNKPKVAATTKLYLARPDVIAKQKEYSAKRYQEKKEEIKARSSARYWAKKDEINAKSRAAYAEKKVQQQII